MVARIIITGKNGKWATTQPWWKAIQSLPIPSLWEGLDIITLEFSELAMFDVSSFASINFMTLSLNLSGQFFLVWMVVIIIHLSERTAVEHNFCPTVKGSGKERGILVPNISSEIQKKNLGKLHTTLVYIF